MLINLEKKYFPNCLIQKLSINKKIIQFILFQHLQKKCFKRIDDVNIEDYEKFKIKFIIFKICIIIRPTWSQPNIRFPKKWKSWFKNSLRKKNKKNPKK